MFKKLKTYLPKGEFAKNVLTLMTGTTIAQAIPIAISPILTRIYTPADFGILALFMSITAITGVISNAKYEQAIVLPKKDSDAINILALGIGISIIISIILLIIVLLFNNQIVEQLGNNEIKPWLYFVPISTLFLGIYNSLNFYNIRKKKFKNKSVSIVTKSSSLGITQIGLGLLSKGALGLIIGQITSYFTGNLILYKALKEKKDFKADINKITIKKLAKKYKKFPMFSMPSIFLNSLNLNMASFLITSIFSITTLGFYALTQRIIGIPARVIGNSFSQVYFQKATEEYNKKGHTNRVFLKTVKKLFLIGLPIFTILFFISEPIFAFVFGEEWRISGIFAKILIPLALIRFVSSSLSITLSIHQKQQYSLYINLLLLLTTLSIFYYGKYNNLEFVNILTIFSLILSIEYLLFLYLYSIISQKKS